MRNQVVRKRRQFTNSQRQEILTEHTLQGIPLTIVARKHGIHPITLTNWKRKLREKNMTAEIDINTILRENEELKSQLSKIKSAHSEAVIDVKDRDEVIDFLKKKWREQLFASQKNSKKKVKLR